MKQARAYSGALDQRDEQTRMQTQQRAQTIRSMQTKKYELDERKMGFSQPRMQSISAPPTFDAIHPGLNQDSPVVQVLQKAMRQEAPAPVSKVTGVNTGLNNQNNPLHSSFQPAMPNDSLVQQATNNFRQWNKQYEQDEDLSWTTRASCGGACRNMRTGATTGTRPLHAPWVRQQGMLC